MRVRLVRRAVLCAGLIIAASSASVASGRVASERPSSLALVPLTKAVIGKAARSLPLQPGSGVVSNADTFAVTAGFQTPEAESRAGRLTGYLLTYGDAFSNNARIGQISTDVAEWRSPEDARRGFRRGVADLLDEVGLSRFGLKTAVATARAPAVGVRHALLIETQRFEHGKTLHAIHEQATDGRYTLNVGVYAWGPNSAALRHFGAVLLGRLDHRLHLALAGHLYGASVHVPSFHKPGPPAHGPTPAKLAFRQSYLDKLFAKYGRDYHARYYSTGFVSSYYLVFATARLTYLSQEIDLAANNTAAQYWAAHLLWSRSHAGTYGDAEIRTRPIHLDGIHDHALAEIVRRPLQSGQLSSDVLISLRSGPWLDDITLFQRSPLPRRVIRRWARQSARSLNHGLHP